MTIQCKLRIAVPQARNIDNRFFILYNPMAQEHNASRRGKTICLYQIV